MEGGIGENVGNRAAPQYAMERKFVERPVLMLAKSPALICIHLVCLNREQKSMHFEPNFIIEFEWKQANATIS